MASSLNIVILCSVIKAGVVHRNLCSHCQFYFVVLELAPLERDE